MVNPTPRERAPCNETSLEYLWGYWLWQNHNKKVRHGTPHGWTLPKPCLYCPGMYTRSVNLGNHIKKIHSYAASSLKSCNNISTQTVIQGKNEITNIYISWITNTYRNSKSYSISLPYYDRQRTYPPLCWGIMM